MATQEAEIRRIEVQSQPDGVAQGVGPEFKPQNLKKKEKKGKKPEQNGLKVWLKR
jgi:hypothetical protein